MGSDLVHVLLVSFPAQGHINPFLRLAKRLASKGLLVTFSTTEAIAHMMQKATNNITATNTLTPIGKGHLRFDFFSDGWDVDHPQRNDLDAYMVRLNSVGPTSLADLIERQASEGRRVSCVINNPFLPWVLDVATDMSIPCGVLWVQSCAVFSTYYHYLHNLAKFPTSSEPHISVQLPGMPLLKADDLPSFLIPGTPYGCLTELILGQFKNLSKASWVMVDSFDELENSILESISPLVPITPIGPLFKSIDTDSDSTSVRGDMWKAVDCLEWLDSHSPASVIYISFGSVVVLGGDQMEEMAWGLRNSKRPFLWVVRPTENSAETGLPKGFLEEIEVQGKVVQWCPQDRVLSHPSIACFVTHCGWNSTMESLSCGIPIIAFPQWGDQITNAKFISDVYGVGLRLGHRKGGPLVTREEVERCVAEMTDGGPKAEEIKKNSMKWKEAAEKAVGKGGSSDQNIQAIVDDVRG
ncbi:gallate 1-beta-glucosyltransferase 84A24-like [Magnolia sinica]|uniref:gallate 1-beta-glucosyltransferase 84A24-like n=1 Tax=Magnolia sinica TaxID=86752 RepID=UPI00265AC735|nr:gallate 1-beta-glucosyltransferase 84A24-like [Magnolia sinica]